MENLAKTFICRPNCTCFVF